MEPYSTLSYWNKRYSKISETYDWYSIWPSLKTHLPFELESGSNILHIGCGSSRLGQDLYDEGVRNVKNIDISPVCIEGMKAMFPHLDYEVMDVFDIGSHFKGPTFDFVIDKGCLDTLLCQENCEELIPVMLKEIHGLLRDSGCLVIVTLGCPDNRMMYLEPSELWHITVTKILKDHTDFIDVARPLLRSSGSSLGVSCRSSRGSTETPTVVPPTEEWVKYYIYLCHKRI